MALWIFRGKIEADFNCGQALDCIAESDPYFCVRLTYKDADWGVPLIIMYLGKPNLFHRGSQSVAPNKSFE